MFHSILKKKIYSPKLWRIFSKQKIHTHMHMCYLRVLLGCESIGIIILPRVPLLAARERSSVEMLLDASSPSAPGTSKHPNIQTGTYSPLFRLSKRKLRKNKISSMFSTGTESFCSLGVRQHYSAKLIKVPSIEVTWKQKNGQKNILSMQMWQPQGR